MERKKRIKVAFRISSKFRSHKMEPRDRCLEMKKAFNNKTKQKTREKVFLVSV
jgi:hypothetical protein